VGFLKVVINLKHRNIIEEKCVPVNHMPLTLRQFQTLQGLGAGWKEPQGLCHTCSAETKPTERQGPGHTQNRTCPHQQQTTPGRQPSTPYLPRRPLATSPLHCEEGRPPLPAIRLVTNHLLCNKHSKGPEPDTELTASPPPKHG
jgi:hypothetical protein